MAMTLEQSLRYVPAHKRGKYTALIKRGQASKPTPRVATYQRLAETATKARKTGERMGVLPVIKKGTPKTAYQRVAGKLEKKATYLKSPKGLAVETFKGLPSAAVKIGKGIRYFFGGGEYGRRQDIRTRERMKWWEQEKIRRGLK